MYTDIYLCMYIHIYYMCVREIIYIYVYYPDIHIHTRMFTSAQTHKYIIPKCINCSAEETDDFKASSN